jgi:hypothetical protein
MWDRSISYKGENYTGKGEKINMLLLWRRGDHKYCDELSYTWKLIGRLSPRYDLRWLCSYITFALFFSSFFLRVDLKTGSASEATLTDFPGAERNVFLTRRARHTLWSDYVELCVTGGNPSVNHGSTASTPHTPANHRPMRAFAQD